jgi:hydroxymethylbilane synthase
MRTQLIIGSRGSKLAMTQSQHVADLLHDHAPAIGVSIEVFSTRGDEILDKPLAEIGGKGLFTEELEEAMRDGRIDMAVHSMKDLPTALAEGLCLGGVPPREAPYDAFVSARYAGLDALPEGARVGTSSLRRKAQLLARRPDLQVVDIRGNVETRIRKTTDGTVDAAVLACAGMQRLNRADDIREVLVPEIMVPAVGQGALAIEARSDDAELLALLRRLSDDATWAEITAERALLARLEGGCQVPMGALARVAGDHLTLTAVVCSLDGRRVVRAEVSGPVSDAHALGIEAAERLRRDGAAALIHERRARLYQRKIVVTRASHQTDGLVEHLARLGAEVIALPTIEIVAPERDEPCDAYDAYDWIVFTSVNGVAMFLERLAREQYDTGRLAGVKIAAVGSATEAAVRDGGLPVCLVPEAYVAEGMLEALTQAEPSLAGVRFLLPRADIARSFLPEELRNAGADVRELVVYRTAIPEVDEARLDALLDEAPSLVVFTSSSTATNFHALLGAERIETLKAATDFASIGPITTQTAEALGMPIAIEPKRHDVEGLVAAIDKYYNP